MYYNLRFQQFLTFVKFYCVSERLEQLGYSARNKTDIARHLSVPLSSNEHSAVIQGIYSFLSSVMEQMLLRAVIRGTI